MIACYRKPNPNDSRPLLSEYMTISHDYSLWRCLLEMPLLCAARPSPLSLRLPPFLVAGQTLAPSQLDHPRTRVLQGY